jgi:hypothetical protein
MSRIEDAFVPVEVVKQRFDEAFDRVEMLVGLVTAQQRSGYDLSDLSARLIEAEAEQALLYAALRSAQHRKSVPVSAIHRGPASTNVALIGASRNTEASRAGPPSV